MGITCFVIFIASVLAGVMVLLFKNILENTPGYKEYRQALKELQEFDRKNDIQHRRAALYSHNYMVSLEQARCERDRRRKVVNTVS